MLGNASETFDYCDNEREEKERRIEEKMRTEKFERLERVNPDVVVQAPFVSRCEMVTQACCEFQMMGGIVQRMNTPRRE